MEDWKSIEGYENQYLISNEGRVKSLYDNVGRKQELIRQPRKSKNGYLYLNLWKNGKSKSKKIHRLVAETFIPNPLNLPQVNHIDGNKENNKVKNLEWCNAQYNTAHASKLGLRNNCIKYGENNFMHDKHGKDNPFSKAVEQLDLDGNLIKEWESIKEAQQATKITHISDVCLGRRKMAGGYLWRHK